MNPLNTIAAAHRQVRKAPLDDEMRMALRMTEDFSEEYFRTLDEDEKLNPFKQLRSEFAAEMAAEKAFNMSMSLGRVQGTLWEQNKDVN